MSPPSRSSARRLPLMLRYAASLALVVGFAWAIDWERLRQVPDTIDREKVVAGILIAGCAYPLLAWRWWLVARSLGLRPSFQWAHQVTWISQFYACFLPGGIGGELARGFIVLRAAPTQRAEALASVVWDRALGVLVLLGMAVVAGLLKLHVVIVNPELRLVLLFAGVFVLGGVGLIWQLQPSAWPVWIRRRIDDNRVSVLQALVARLRTSSRVLVGSIAISVGVWLLDFFAIALFARSAGLTLPFLEVVISGCVAYAVATLPVSVGGHGVREGGLLFTLAAFGLISDAGPIRDAALLLALLVWASTVFWSLVGGLVLLASRPLMSAAAGKSASDAQLGPTT